MPQTDFQRGFNTGTWYENYKEMIEKDLSDIKMAKISLEEEAGDRRAEISSSLRCCRHALEDIRLYHGRIQGLPQDHFIDSAREFVATIPQKIKQIEEYMGQLEAQLSASTPTP